MTRAAPIPDTVTIHVPFRVVKRGGRKEMILPDAALAQHRHVDNTLIKGLARAFRWKRMLDTGACPTLGDLASQEKISPSYLTRVLRLTLLAPDILPSFSVADFGARGTILGAAGRGHAGPLALIELQNGDPAIAGNEASYVAGTENFYVITRYNWSSYYAMAVIDLGQEVAAVLAQGSY